MPNLRGILITSTLGHIFKSVRYFNSTKVVRNTMEQKPILFGDEASPPVRFVMMTASYLKIDLNMHKVDLFRAENKSDFYKKINPLQKVPALVVQDNIICDSHAIALYLCQISKIQDLYPTDAMNKAKVDQMLFFNSGSLFPTDSAIFSDYFASKPADEQLIQHWNHLLDHLEDCLSKNDWLAGDKMSLCDLCCATTVSSLQLLIPALDCHVKLNQWMKKLQKLPCFEINTKGLALLKQFVEMMKSLK